jgi:hypothetical protein
LNQKSASFGLKNYRGTNKGQKNDLFCQFKGSGGEGTKKYSAENQHYIRFS